MYNTQNRKPLSSGFTRLLIIAFFFVVQNAGAQLPAGITKASLDDTTSTPPEGMVIKNGKLAPAKGYTMGYSADKSTVVFSRAGGGSGGGLEMTCVCRAATACGVVITDGLATCGSCMDGEKRTACDMMVEVPGSSGSITIKPEDTKSTKPATLAWKHLVINVTRQ